jgi:hypothetical protein
MFYADNILAKKGPLATIWLAAHWDKKLSKCQINQTDITLSVKDIIEGKLPPMALRLSGQLLLGVAKIYWRKTKYLFDDCNDAVFKIKVTFTTAPNAGQSGGNHPNQPASSSITIPVAAQDLEMLVQEPAFDLEAILQENASQKPTNGSSELTLNLPSSFMGFDDEGGDKILHEFNIEIPRRDFERRLSSLLESPPRAMEIERRALEGETEIWAGGFDEIEPLQGKENLKPFQSPLIPRAFDSPKIRDSEAITIGTPKKKLKALPVDNQTLEVSFEDKLPFNIELSLDLLPDAAQSPSKGDKFSFDDFLKESLQESIGSKLASLVMQKANIVTPVKPKSDKDEESFESPKLATEEFGGGFNLGLERTDKIVSEPVVQAQIVEQPTAAIQIDILKQLFTEGQLKKFSFQDLCLKSGIQGREGVVDAFLQVLTQATAGTLILNQPRPYGSIEIAARGLPMNDE